MVIKTKYNMSKIVKALSYSFNRNIGWQDRTIRTIAGIVATVGAIYFFKTNFTTSMLLAVLAVTQGWTVLSARCIICYFIGQCTIGSNERKSLTGKGIPYES